MACGPGCSAQTGRTSASPRASPLGASATPFYRRLSGSSPDLTASLQRYRLRMRLPRRSDCCEREAAQCWQVAGPAIAGWCCACCPESADFVHESFHPRRSSVYRWKTFQLQHLQLAEPSAQIMCLPNVFPRRQLRILQRDRSGVVATRLTRAMTRVRLCCSVGCKEGASAFRCVISTRARKRTLVARAVHADPRQDSRCCAGTQGAGPFYDEGVCQRLVNELPCNDLEGGLDEQPLPHPSCQSDRLKTCPCWLLPSNMDCV